MRLTVPLTTASAPIDPSKGTARATAAPGLVAGGLLVLALWFVLTYPLSGRDPLVPTLLYTLLVYSSVRAGACIHSTRPRIAMLVFWVFVYSILGVVQVVQLSARENPFQIVLPDALVITALFMILVGCVAADLTSTLISARRADSDETSASPRRVIALSHVVAIGVASLLLTPYFIQANGGLGALFTSRQEVLTFLRGGIDDVAPGQGVPRLAANVIPFVALFALLRLRMAGAFTFKGRVGLAVLAILLLAQNVVLNNPISQPRYWIATMLIALILSTKWLRRPRNQALFAAGLVFAALVAFPFLDYFRNTSGPVDPGQSATYYYTNKMDYGSGPDVVHTVYYTGARGHTDGRQLAGAMLFFIPRASWPDKPPQTSWLLADVVGHVNPNIDTPLWAEGYIDFGLPGTIAFMSAFGALAGAVDRALLHRPSATSLASVLFPILVGYELIVLRGSLLQALARLSLVLLMCVLVTRRNPGRGPFGLDRRVRSSCGTRCLRHSRGARLAPARHPGVPVDQGTAFTLSDTAKWF